MSLLRHTLEEERHEPIPADGDPYGVPTGVVPRVSPAAELARQLTQPDPPLPRRFVGIAALQHDPIAQAVDDWLLMERKAAAWDWLRQNFHASGRQTLVDLMDSYIT